MKKYKIMLKEHLNSVILSNINDDDFDNYKDFICFIIEELSILSDSLEIGEGV